LVLQEDGRTGWGPNAAAGLLVTAAMLPRQASALPGAGVAETQARPALVQRVASKYNRRYYRDNGTYVRAPFADLWVPR
jgi:hypothetical protein